MSVEGLHLQEASDDTSILVKTDSSSCDTLGSKSLNTPAHLVASRHADRQIRSKGMQLIRRKKAADCAIWEYRVIMQQNREGAGHTYVRLEVVGVHGFVQKATKEPGGETSRRNACRNTQLVLSTRTDAAIISHKCPETTPVTTFDHAGS